MAVKKSVLKALIQVTLTVTNGRYLKICASARNKHTNSLSILGVLLHDQAHIWSHYCLHGRDKVRNFDLTCV
jgi:hypothetical protein